MLLANLLCYSAQVTSSEASSLQGGFHENGPIEAHIFQARDGPIRWLMMKPRELLLPSGPKESKINLHCLPKIREEISQSQESTYSTAMAEKLAPEKRHVFAHNGLSSSLSLPRPLLPVRVWFSAACIGVLRFRRIWCRFWWGIAGQKVFEWDQTLEEINIYINLPPNVHPKQFYCKIQSKHVEVGIKGNPPYLNVSSSLHSIITVVCSSFIQ